MRIKLQIDWKKVAIIGGIILVVVGLLTGLIVGLGVAARADGFSYPWPEVFQITQAVLVGIMAISCITMIVCVLASPPETGVGKNVITGAAESYYTKNRGKSNKGRLQLAIVILATIVATCAIMYFILYGIYQGA